MRTTSVSLLVAIVVSAPRCNAERENRLSSDDEAEYRVFRESNGRAEQDSVSFEERLAHYRRFRQAVLEHNSQPGVSWKAVINKFADYTEDEFTMLLGHRRSRRTSDSETSSFLQTAPQRNFAASVDWSRNLTSVTSVREQGGCGSCWAEAAIGALEMYEELISGKGHALSSNQVKDCAPNKEHCGGTGGCEGSTAELAYAYVSEKGVAKEHEYGGNKNKDEKCRESEFRPAVMVKEFVRLPVNKLDPLKEALSNVGPVVVSIDATGWGMYGSGVFNSCKEDAIVNHAVVATGYGRDGDKDYWLIRNSWGKTWGEKGFIRLFRHQGDTGADGFCGTDNKPQEGVGCEGGPPTIPVCGMCGVLSDSCYPSGVTVPSVKKSHHGSTLQADTLQLDQSDA